MAEIISFIAGSIFSLLVAGGCLWLSYKVLQFKEETEIRREEKRKKLIKRPISSGGVIRPKTQEEVDNQNSEELKAFADLLRDPNTE